MSDLSKRKIKGYIFEQVKFNINYTKFKLNTLIVCVLCSIIYLYYPFIQDYSTTPKCIILSVFSIIVFILPSQRQVHFSWPLAIWGVFSLQFFLQAFRSANFWEAITHLSPILIAPLVILALFKHAENPTIFYKNFGILLAIMLTPILLISLAEISSWVIKGVYSHQSTYKIRYSFGHRNQFAQFLTLSVPFIFLSLGITKKKRLKTLLVTIIFIIYLTVALLMNRTSLIVLFGIYPLCLFLFWLSSKSQKIKKRIGILSIIVGFLFSALLIVKPSLVPGAKHIFETSFGSGNERVRIWENSLDLFKEQPLVGHGSGDWKIEILRFPLQFTQAENGMVFYQRAHNDFIQIAIENGSVGLILIVLFFAIGLIQLIRSNNPKSYKYALIAGFLGFIVICNLSFPFEKVELLILLFAFLLPSVPVFSKPKKKVIPTFSKFCLILLSISMLVIGLIKIKNEQQYALFKKTNQVSILKSINQNFYTIDPISTPIGWHIGNDFFQREMFLKAIESYQQALENNPYHIHVINNLASTYVKISAIELAKKYYDLALTLSPKFTETLMNCSALEFNLGNIDGALGHILQVKISQEPASYKGYISAIGQAKCQWLIDLYDEESFEQFLIEHANNGEFLYNISVQSRTTSASFEDELRRFHDNSKLIMQPIK